MTTPRSLTSAPTPTGRHTSDVRARRRVTTGTAVRDGTAAVVAIACVQFAVLLTVAGRYGYHRDELYFLQAGRRPALGYVDQPPLVPLLARVQDAVLGGSVASLRVLPALASAGAVVAAGLLARELGGDRRARVVAAAAVSGGGFLLASGHLLSTATFDLALWMVALLPAARMLRTGDARMWLPIGAVVGVALWNKQLVLLLPAALATGMIIDRRWRLLTSGWSLAGLVLAIAIAAPTLWWQAANGWPQVGMAHALSQRLGAENRITLLPLQVVLLGPALLPFAVAGVRMLWGHRDDGHRCRPLLWAYVAALLVTLATGGRPYYPLPLAAAVMVAGTVALAHADRVWVGVLLGINAVTGALVALPVLPAPWQASLPFTAVNTTLAETVGWPDLAAQVADVVAALPATERDHAVLLTGTYGEAGALDRYGPALGLPSPYSGHNSYWHWRRPTDDDAAVVAVGMSRAFLHRHFAACHPAGRIDNGLGIDNEAQGGAIWICRGLRDSWRQRWPAFRHHG